MNKVKINYYVKADKANSEGKVPIYGKIIYLDSDVTFSTKCWVSPKAWESFRNGPKNLPEEKKLSKELIEIESAIEKIEIQLIATNQSPTAKRIKQILLKKESVEPNAPEKIMVSRTMDELIEEKEALIKRKRRTPASMTKYNTVKFYFFNFLKQKKKIEDIALQDLKYNLITDFYLYLTEDKVIDGKFHKKIGNNTSQKYIENFRATISFAIKMDYIKQDPFRKYVYEWDEVETVFLTQAELGQIENATLNSERLEVIRDIFIFSCYTGFAPIDLKELNHQNIEKRNDGNLWFNKRRQKTDIKCEVMVFERTQMLIDKYVSDPYCIAKNMLLPYRANQTMNEYLKELATISGITKNLHHYVARHTFATTNMLEKGASLEVTMKALGHKRITQTQHYAKLTNRRITEEMEAVDKNMSENILVSKHHSLVK